MTHEEVWAAYLRLLRIGRKNPATVHSYRVALHKLWTWLQVHGKRWDEVTPELVDAWLEEPNRTGRRNAGQPKSPGTRNTYWRRVATFYALAAEEGWIGSNPLRRAAPPPRPAPRRRALTVDALRALLLVVDVRIRTMILIGYHQGLRISEVCQLSVEDVRLHGDPPNILIHGKGGKDEEMDLSPALIPLLRAFLITRPAAGPLIPNYRDPGRHLSGRYASRMVAAVMRPEVGDSFHALRHTTATQLARLTGDPFIVRDALRHADLSTLLTYVGQSDKLAGALARLPDPLQER